MQLMHHGNEQEGVSKYSISTLNTDLRVTIGPQGLGPPFPFTTNKLLWPSYPLFKL